MEIESTIRAYQKALATHRFTDASSFSEGFAQARFLKKFQEPDHANTSNLKQECWSNWISFDSGLPSKRTTAYKGTWYRARLKIHEALTGFMPGVPTFPKGSSFIPSRGEHSIEARLLGEWTVTRDCFEQFALLCYSHSALKRAARRKYKRWYTARDFDIDRKAADMIVYNHYKSKSDVGFRVFRWKLAQIVIFVHGSRFSTVPKNNISRRPINIEPLGNILVQSSLGEGFRSTLKTAFSQDLDRLQTVHRKRISDLRIATIDLKNASDSISIDLCRFLLPKRIFKLVSEARSELIFGPDGQYHVPRKISSMGNGFTFELMTLILTALCRSIDCDSSVYGDDIIISADRANHLIECLEDVGFVVNPDKSFLSGPFRESCGGNYHAAEGYIKSFDFLWPTTIADCQLICNKLAYLAVYPSFRELYQRVCRITPPVLQGGPCITFIKTDPVLLTGRHDCEDDLLFPPFFVTPRNKCDLKMVRTVYSGLLAICENPASFKLAVGFTFVPKERSKQVSDMNPRRHWAKYEMYLSSGRRAKDIITGEGSWVKVYYVTDGRRYFRAKALCN